MAITKLNSLAIPDDTIVEADLSYPLTNFSSTGIDDNASSTAVTLDSSQNVGVGTPSPADKVHVEGGNLRVGADDNTNHSARVILNSGGASGYEAAVDFKYEGNSESRAKIHVNSSLSGLIFSTIQSGSITEDMRLDGAGRLLIGKDAVNNSTAGYMFEAGSTGYAAFTNTGTATSHRVILCNRQSGDGSLIDLQRAGSLKGTIGINSGDEPYFARSVGTTSGIKIANGALYPCQSDGTDHDDAQNLGRSNVRWANLYLSGGAYLGGTGSANHLDDYEEGTFTLTLGTIYGGSPNFSNSIAGRYVKIGKIVHCEFQSQLNGSNAISVDDRFGFSGLPFGIKTNQAAQGTAVIHASYGGGHSSFWNTRGSGNTLLMWCHHEDGAVDYGDEIIGSLTYETS